MSRSILTVIILAGAFSALAGLYLVCAGRPVVPASWVLVCAVGSLLAEWWTHEVRDARGRLARWLGIMIGAVSLIAVLGAAGACFDGRGLGNAFEVALWSAMMALTASEALIWSPSADRRRAPVPSQLQTGNHWEATSV